MKELEHLKFAKAINAAETILSLESVGNILAYIEKLTAERDEARRDCAVAEQKHALAVKEREAQYKAYFEMAKELIDANVAIEILKGRTVRDKEQIIAEAVKEFAERLKAKEAIHLCKCGKPFVYTDLFNGEIDNIVKEMAGESND